MKRPFSIAIALAAALVPAAARAETPKPSAAATMNLTYAGFLAQVARGNLDLAAQRASVTIAEAQIAVARVFNDPTLTAGVASVDVSGKGSPLATTVGLSYTIELGGKRSARVAAAQGEHAAAKAELEEYLRTLRGTATNGFVDSLYARLALERKTQTLKGYETLVSVNEERLRSGDIGKTALTQSRVEAQRFRGEVVTAQAEVEAADLALAQLMGMGAAPGEPYGDLKIKPRTFEVRELVARALSSRPDLAAKRAAAEAAAGRVDVAQANRFVDVTLNVGWQHSFASSMSSQFGQQIAYDALSATVSVPLPLSKVYRGELDAALATQSQARTAVQSIELKVEIEVRQALARYNASVSKVGLYTGGLLSDADQVLEATMFSYKRGSATLLEVLEAQRTQNDVYLAYYDALAEHAKALVALEQAAGIWDLAL